MTEPENLVLHLLHEIRAEMATKALEARLRRVEQHLNLSPSEAH